MKDIEARLAALHPAHEKARGLLLDLLAASELATDLATPKGRSSLSSSGPFLSAENPLVSARTDPAAVPVLLDGPPGVGKHHLAASLVQLAPEAVGIAGGGGLAAGLQLWCTREGKRPPECPAHAVVVPVRSLSRAERKRIVQDELIPRAAQLYGIDPVPFQTVDLLGVILEGGFPEAGLKGAQTRLERLCRRRLRELSQGGASVPDLTWATQVLGAEAIPQDRTPARLRPGSVLAPLVSSQGGALAVVQALGIPGRGRLQVTGLGAQAQAACEVARSRLLVLAPALHATMSEWRDLDWHVHVVGPAGPRDGSSLGLAVLVAMVSSLLGHRMDAHLAITGELGLSGEILPVGGVEEKFLACERMGLTRFLLPEANLPDLSGLEPGARGECIPAGLQKDDALVRSLNLKGKTEA